jgi:hypothetical protein
MENVKDYYRKLNFSLPLWYLILFRGKIDVNKGIFWIFKELHLTLLHLPLLEFHCFGGCWDRTQESCDFSIGSQTP